MKKHNENTHVGSCRNTTNSKIVSWSPFDTNEIGGRTRCVIGFLKINLSVIHLSKLKFRLVVTFAYLRNAIKII